MDRRPRIAIVTRGDGGRFAAIAVALRAKGFAPEICTYDEARELDVWAQLSACDAALVFVNPVQDGRRRGRLDALLEDALAAGVLVSGRPDVIARMGVKAVLWRTRRLGWSGDARFYGTTAGPRVLKPNRGNGGQGVWKVAAGGDGRLEVQAATAPEVFVVDRAEFFSQRSAEIADADGFVDQAYQARLPEGMVRCYMTGGRLAGFGHHLVRMLAPADAGPGGPRLYSGPDDPRFQRLRAKIETEWTPALCRELDLAPDDLPVIWDADFLLGPADAAGRDTHVLCEINASCVFPIPDEAPAAMAESLATRLASRRLGGPSALSAHT
jgi:hypothetical protein